MKLTKPIFTCLIFFSLPCFAGLDYFLKVERANLYVASGFTSAKDLHNLKMAIAKSYAGPAEQSQFAALPTPEDPQNYKFIINLNRMQVLYKDRLVDDFVFFAENAVALNGQIYAQRKNENPRQFFQRILTTEPLGHVSYPAPSMWLSSAYAAPKETSYRTFFLNASAQAYSSPNELLAKSAELMKPNAEKKFVHQPVTCTSKTATGSILFQEDRFTFEADAKGVQLKADGKTFLVKPKSSADYDKICEGYKNLSREVQNSLRKAYEEKRDLDSKWAARKEDLERRSFNPEVQAFRKRMEPQRKRADENLQALLKKHVPFEVPPENYIFTGLCNAEMSENKDLRIVLDSEIQECTDAQCTKTAKISSTSPTAGGPLFFNYLGRLKEKISNKEQFFFKDLKYSQLVDIKIVNDEKIVADWTALEKEMAKMDGPTLSKVTAFIRDAKRILEEEQKLLYQKKSGPEYQQFQAAMTSLVSLYDCCQSNQCRQYAYESNNKLILKPAADSSAKPGKQ